MELKEVIEKRASVRKFTDEEVCSSDLKEMVRIAGLAPSANNSQPWKFIAIKNRGLLKQMGDVVRKKIDEVLPNVTDEDEKRSKMQVEWFSTFFETAPAVIAVAKCPYEAIIDKALKSNNLRHEDVSAKRWHPDIQSIGASVQNLLLAATEMGYGSCWMSGPMVAHEELNKTLNLDKPWDLVALVVIGRPAAAIKPREKKQVDEIFELRD